MSNLKTVTESIFNRLDSVHAKSSSPIFDSLSKYVVINKNDKELCEEGLCQYIYVIRRHDIDSIKFFNMDEISKTCEKLFDLDFFEDRVEFFNNVYNGDGYYHSPFSNHRDYERFVFVGLSNEDIVSEDLSDYISEKASRGVLNLIGKDRYFTISRLSVMAIIEDDGTIGVYRVIGKNND